MWDDSGWTHLTFAGLFLAPWTAFVASVRQKEAFARDQELTFALERSELGGAGLHQSASGLGTGLTALRERLQLVFGDAAQLRLMAGAPRGVIVEVDMPVRP